MTPKTAPNKPFRGTPITQEEAEAELSTFGDDDDHEPPAKPAPARCVVPGCASFALAHLTLCAQHRSGNPL